MHGAFRTRLRRIGDIGIPLLTGLLVVAVGLDGTEEGGPRGLAVVAGVVQGAALWWRQRHPVRVMAIVLAGATVTQIIAPEGLFPYAALIAMTALAKRRPPYVSFVGLGGLLAVTALNFFENSADDTWFAMLVAVVAWALGDAARSRQSALDEAARRAAGDEQARIARELHDVLAHSVSVIVVQAAAADDVFDERPDQARSALRSIEATGREALGDLRRLLAGVRPGETAELQPGLQQLGELAESLRAAGLQVALRRDADRPLPAVVDLSAYRIVQEALTNTLRHAGASRAEVTVSVADGVLELDVVDDGHGGAVSADGGRGIAGMRERAALLGGTLDAGPLDGGGFRVHARLPLGGAS